jgi:hypothetical protein
MTTLREAAQAALDALTESVDLVQNAYDENWRHGLPARAAQLAAEKTALDAHKSAIEALRTALAAQPAPDAMPVAAVDYGSLVKAAYSLHRYAQGTGACIAFKRGAEWQASSAAPIAQQADPDMRHPKIQALIGAKARLAIELSLVEELLEDPNCDIGAMSMEYWGPLHDRLKDALTKVAQQAAPAPDLTALHERGAVAWAGVDAQELREGGPVAPAQAFAPDWAGYRQGLADGAAQARQPLTEAQIQELWVSGAVGPFAFARAIEAAHGITAAKKGE